MNKFLVVFLALFAITAAYDFELLTEEDINKWLDEVPPEQRGLILNSQAKKAVRDAMEQMPCGWPEYGIPPLAPYTNPDLEVKYATGTVLDAFLQALRFRLDGLDQLEIIKLKISYTFSKSVKFDFRYKELKSTARILNTDTLVDLLKKLGVSVRYEGTGPLAFSLHDLRVSGEFKYKLPILIGSAKIYKLKIFVSLGGVTSNIGGILGNGGMNGYINDKIELMIPAYINGNQPEISAMLENTIEPRVNTMLKGKKIWSLLGMIGSGSTKCNPTPAPWLAEV